MNREEELSSLLYRGFGIKLKRHYHMIIIDFTYYNLFYYNGTNTYHYFDSICPEGDTMISFGLDSLEGFPVSPIRVDEIIDIEEMHFYTLETDEGGRLIMTQSLFASYYEKATEIYDIEAPKIPDTFIDAENIGICWEFFKRILMLKRPDLNLKFLKYLKENDLRLYMGMYRIMSDQLSTRLKNTSNLLTMTARRKTGPIMKGGIILKITDYILEVECYHSNRFKYPKGSIEIDDEDWIECGLRELWEETGIKLVCPPELEVGKPVNSKYVHCMYRNYRDTPFYYENYLCVEISVDNLKTLTTQMRFKELFSGEITKIRLASFLHRQFKKIRKKSFIPVTIDRET